MDLREKKTRRALRTAFKELRRTTPLERVAVKTLCERAEVGKATFYLHYHSVYDLSHELQNEVVDEMMNDLADPMALLERPAEATRALFSSVAARREELDTLFSQGQEHVLAESLERELRRRIEEAAPERRGDVRLDVLLTYLVEGAYHSYMRLARSSEPERADRVIEAIGEASEAVVRAMLR